MLPTMSVRSSQVDLAGSESMFGSIGQGGNLPGNFDFLPSDANGGTIDLTGNSINVNARWLGLDNKSMQFWAYNYCSPLSAVIDRLAEADANGIIEFRDEDGITLKKEKVNRNPKLLRIKRLLKKPNPWQTWEEYDSEQVVLCKIFGYCPVFAICPAGMDKSFSVALINLSPFYAQPQFNYEFDLFKKDSPIKLWRITILGKSYEIPAEDVLLIKDGFINTTNNSNVLPISKIAGLDYFVSNICAAMEADNVLLKKKGPLGVFSHAAKPDIAGMVPMTPGAKDDLQDDLKRYGLTSGQLQYIVSKWPVKWEAMSFNLRDLMTKETIRSGIDGICDRFGYPAELMSGKNATYENRNSAEKFLYQNNIIPFSLRRMSRYNYFFGLEESMLYMDYNHLPVLQEDIMNAGQARRANSESIQIDWEGGRLSWNECRVLQDMDEVSGMDIYYPEWLEKNPNVQKTDTKDKLKDNETKPKN